MTEAVQQNKWLSNPLVAQVLIGIILLFTAKGFGWFDTQNSNTSSISEMTRQVSKMQVQMDDMQKQLAQDHLDNEKRFLARDVFDQFVAKQDQNHLDAVTWREENAGQLKLMQETLNALVAAQRRQR